MKQRTIYTSSRTHTYTHTCTSSRNTALPTHIHTRNNPRAESNRSEPKNDTPMCVCVFTNADRHVAGSLTLAHERRATRRHSRAHILTRIHSHILHANAYKQVRVHLFVHTWERSRAPYKKSIELIKHRSRSHKLSYRYNCVCLCLCVSVRSLSFTWDGDHFIDRGFCVLVLVQTHTHTHTHMLTNAA